ncbi:MAG TPA: 30S ribosomal protein S3 [Candidatus Onthousia excrementipullorum]|uniref:Small ribosomal subunit protein uS3 n=1 Tax=Candidatus Onthousia excrementipullorum TaxID=2840884 RepID=A0A9D1DVG5_9FIRM|nr:30S ribosomal protein S3 [Candidatus Onthousia excrementipullorum]
MGQKVNPNGLRLGINKDWEAKWYAPKGEVSSVLVNDIKIREYLEKNLKNAGIAKVEIERTPKKCEVSIHTSRPGVIIGRGGEEITKLKDKLSKVVGENIQISIVDIKKADLNAQLVADSIASQITNRASFRMAQKRAIRNAMKAGAKGIKTKVSGRLGGADMARSEGYTEGTIPLHTLRADVDYATSEADTTYGKIGVKVWIYKGEILPSKNKVSKDTKEVKERKERKAKGGN